MSTQPARKLEENTVRTDSAGNAVSTPKARTGADYGPTGYRWVVFSILALAYLFVFFHRLSPAVIAVDMMRDLNVGAAAMGGLAAAYFYSYALMQIPVGLMSDSWGPRRSITLFFAIAGVGSLLFGVAGSFGMAMFARTLVGMGVAMVFVASLKVMTRWFPSADFARMTGLLMAVGGVGVYSASGPLVALSGWLGWRGCFLAIGVITLVLAGVIWLFVRNTPEEMGKRPANPPQLDPGPGNARDLLAGVVKVCKTGAFWPLAIWNLLSGAVFFAFGGLWGGPYLQHVYGLTKGQVGGILSMVAVGIIVGGPFLSYLSDKVLKSRKKVLVSAAALTTLLLLPLALAPTSMPVAFFYPWFVLFTAASASIVVIVVTATKELFPLHLAGTATGLVNLFPFLGAAVMQPVVGCLLEWQSGPDGAFTAQAFGISFFVYLATAIMGVAATCMIRETWNEN